MPDIRSFLDLHPVIAEDAWIDDSAVIIGDVEIGAEASVWPLCVLRGDIHSIKVGARTNIQDSSVLHVTHDSAFNPGGFPVEIGGDVTVGHKVMLHGCRIGSHCLIGMGSIVLDGAVIEPRTILGAGSLVPGGKVLEGGHLWHGSPARKVRALTGRELDFLDYVAKNYVKLAKGYMEACIDSLPDVRNP
jgi:carbonic anhydrase/acetyltransferase-like protein (isoleucine patch superfamily)